jgi:uroporphyrinogen-III synthase
MRLLVTRPQPEADSLARRLAALGHRVTIQPLMDVRLNPQPANLGQPGAIAVTSRIGVRGLAGWQAARAWYRLPLFAVGTATAEAARAAGFADVRAANGDVAALATFIRREFAHGPGPILYPAARDRAVELSTLLPEFTIVTVEAYAAVAVSALRPEVAAALASRSIDGVLLFSRRTATIFRELAGAAVPPSALAAPTYYVLSSEVAAPLQGLGGAVVVAPQPSESGLLSLLHPADG